MKYYLLTWKALKEQDPTSQLYLSFLTKCMTDHKQICLLDNAFEYDSKGKLHFHCVVLTKYVRFQKYSKYCFENDMYFHFVPIKDEIDLEVVRRYLRKQRTVNFVHALERKECIEYFEKGYHFVDEQVGETLTGTGETKE